MAFTKSILQVSAAIFSSRIIGYFREIAMATILGTNNIANAFHVAFRFSNMFRSFFAEGAFSAAFVPIYANKYQSDKEIADEYASKALSWLAYILIILTIIVEIFAPQIMLVLAPGFKDKVIFDNTVLFARINFPYLAFMSISALYAGILNTSGKYFLASFSPVALNICMLIALYIFSSSPNIGVYLSISVIIAGLIQLLIVIFACYKFGHILKLRFYKYDHEMHFFIKRMIPGILSGGVVQINLWFSTIIATYYESAVSIMYYADRIIQLPLALIGTATSIVLLPFLAKKNIEQTQLELQEQRAGIAYNMAIIAITISSMTYAMSYEIIDFTLGYGKFTQQDVFNTAKFLNILSFALPAFMLNKVFTPYFYANHDTMTPFKTAIISLIINLVANISLMKIYPNYLTIAVATVLSAWVNVFLLMLYAYRRKLIMKLSVKKIILCIFINIIISSIFTLFQLKISVISLIFKTSLMCIIYMTLYHIFHIVNFKNYNIYDQIEKVFKSKRRSKT